MISLLLLSLACADPGTSAAPAGAVVAAKPKVLVLDFRDDGVGPNAVRIIRETLVAHVAKDERLEIISSEDVRRAIDRDAVRRESGCDEESCLAEIAEALGAGLTLYGTAGKLGELVVVNVSLFDARTTSTVGRENIEVSSLEALPDPLRAAGDRLIAQLGLAEPAGWQPGPIFYTGAALAGASAVVAIVGVSIWLPNIDAVKRETTFEKKTSAKQAQDTGQSLAIGGVVACAVGLATMAASVALE